MGLESTEGVEVGKDVELEVKALNEKGQAFIDAQPAAENPALEKEADRARRRRLQEKLKGAKTTKDLKKLMRELGADGEADAEEKLASGVVAKPLEPGQKPGWPPPSSIAFVEPMLVDALRDSGAALRGFVTSDDATGDALRAVCECMSGEPGEKLAKAWAPLVALYMPSIMMSPYAPAVIGTAGFALTVTAAVNNALDEREKKEKAKTP